MTAIARKYFTEKKSIYTEYADGKIKKSGHELGVGFYVSQEILRDYFFLMPDDKCFPNEKSKNEFIQEAKANPYEKPGGQIVFFSHRNPLKLELSSKVVNAEPEFKEKIEKFEEEKELRLIDDNDLKL